MGPIFTCRKRRYQPNDLAGDQPMRCDTCRAIPSPLARRPNGIRTGLKRHDAEESRQPNYQIYPGVEASGGGVEIFRLGARRRACCDTGIAPPTCRLSAKPRRKPRRRRRKRREVGSQHRGAHRGVDRGGVERIPGIRSGYHAMDKIEGGDCATTIAPPSCGGTKSSRHAGDQPRRLSAKPRRSPCVVHAVEEEVWHHHEENWDAA